jgi:hypothetical protein
MKQTYLILAPLWIIAANTTHDPFLKGLFALAALRAVLSAFLTPEK